MWCNSLLLLVSHKNCSYVKPLLRCQTTEHPFWCIFEICPTTSESEGSLFSYILGIASMSLGKAPPYPWYGPTLLAAAVHFLHVWRIMCHLTILCRSLVGLIHMKENMPPLYNQLNPRFNRNFPMKDRWT